MAAQEIPEDVMRDARAVAKSVQQSWNEFHVPSTKEVLLVAHAIITERERCAKIARAHAAAEAEERFGQGRMWAASSIAACIEAGDDPERTDHARP